MIALDIDVPIPIVGPNEPRPQPLKRYLVFGENQYYPSGGTGDVIGNVDTLDEAIDCMDADNSDHRYVLDLHTAIEYDHHGRPTGPVRIPTKENA